MSGVEKSHMPLSSSARLWLVAALLFATLLAAAPAQANCVQVRNLLRRGLSMGDVVQFTGISPEHVQACAAGSRVPVVIQPAGPAPHRAAGPPPLGAAGPPPHGAAGPAPHGAAGPAPHGAAGPAPGGFAP
jgi:hypothetical protein